LLELSMPVPGVRNGSAYSMGRLEVDPMICPKCGGRMKVVAFLTEVAVVDRIIDHLKLGFVAAKPPPSHVFEQVVLTRPPREGLRSVALMAAEESGEYF